MQLVGERVVLLDGMKDRRYDAKEVEERFGVPPSQLLDLRALAGDPSDNIPGVTGIGPKGAAELIRRWGDLENLLAHAAEVPGKRAREALAPAGGAGPALEAPRDAAQRRAAPAGPRGGGAARAGPAAAARPVRAARLHAAARGPGARGRSELAGGGRRRGPPDRRRSASWTRWSRSCGRCPRSRSSPSSATTAAHELGPGRPRLRARARAGRLPPARGSKRCSPAGSRPRRWSRGCAGSSRARARCPGPRARPSRSQVWLAEQGLELPAPAFDSELAVQLLDPSGSRSAGGARVAAARDRAAQLGGARRPRRQGAPGERAPGRAGGGLGRAQACAARRLEEPLARELAETGMDALYRSVELPLTRVLARMERAGVRIDEAALGRLSRDFSRAARAARGAHLRAGGRALPDLLAEAAPAAPVREAEAAGGQEDQDRLLDRRGRARAARVAARSAAADPRAPPAQQAQEHLRRRAAPAREPAHRAHPSDLSSARGGDRPALGDPPQRPEHPDPQPRWRAHPRGLRAGRGLPAALGGLLAGRAAHPRPLLGRREPDRGLPPRRGRAPAHGGRGGRDRAGGGLGRAARARQGGQLRDHLRLLGLRPREPARHRERRGAGDHRRLLRALPRRAPLPRRDDRGGAPGGLRAHPARAGAATCRIWPRATAPSRTPPSGWP